MNNKALYEAEKQRVNRLKQVAAFINDEVLPEIYGDRMGFILLVSPFSDGPGIADYISNGERECCIKWLEETLARFKANETIPAVKGNA